MYAVLPPLHHPIESDWEDYHHYQARHLPYAIRPWLLDRTSLTQRLIKSSNGQFKVNVLTQQWQRPRLSESRLLGINPREMAIVREVLLLCAGEPWVFARSIIPSSSLTGRLRRLRKFSDSSLGEMLFSDPSMTRHPFQIATIEGNDPQLPGHVHQPKVLWGRRCRFELSHKAIMVSEIFLPNFKP